MSTRPNDFDYNFDEGPPSTGYTPNPATPGYHADTPSPQGPYNPQTPGSAYSPYQGNPSPSPVSYQGNFFYIIILLIIKHHISLLSIYTIHYCYDCSGIVDVI